MIDNHFIRIPLFAGTLNKAGDTPLSLAYKGGHWEVVKYLAITHHCDTKSKLTLHVLYSIYMCPQFACIHAHAVAVNEAGDTPLSLECSRGNLEMVKALINKHVDPKSECLSVHGCYVVDGDIPQSL